MTRVGFVLKVKEDHLDEYRKRHQAVWPEMLNAMRETGWHNYSLFLRGDGLLFGYFETPGSFDDALEALSKEEANTRWQEAMAPFFEGTGYRPDEMLDELEEIFHID